MMNMTMFDADDVKAATYSYQGGSFFTAVDDRLFRESLFNPLNAPQCHSFIG